jgi:hypothetical protein
MEKSGRSFQVSKINTHRRGFSDSSTFNYNSLTPSTSSKNLNFDRLHTENSVSSSKCASPVSTHRAKDPGNKAISLVIIEKYFSDICSNIANKNFIEKNLLSKATTMQDVLKDCLTAVPDISLQFYVLMASALKEIQEIYNSQDTALYGPLAKKLVQIAGMLEDNKFTSDVDRVATLPSEDIEVQGLRNIASELNLRVTRVTARILNIWKKILSPQREAAVISCAFLLLYCEIDLSLRILPTARIPADKAVSSMKIYLNNPGYVVTIIRKTKEYIDNEQISVETVRRIHDLLQKVTVEQVKNMDKTLTGFAIYELVYFAVKYYYEYAKEHYKIDIFEEPEENRFSLRNSIEKSPLLEEVKVQNEQENAPRVKSNKIIAKSPEKNSEKSLKNSDFHNSPVKPGERSTKPSETTPKSSSIARSPEKSSKSPEKPSNLYKFPEKSSRIIEKAPRVSERPGPTHQKSRSALYSPSNPKDSSTRLTRNPSVSSSKNLLPDRKSLNVFRK